MYYKNIVAFHQHKDSIFKFCRQRTTEISVQKLKKHCSVCEHSAVPVTYCGHKYCSIVVYSIYPCTSSQICFQSVCFFHSFFHGFVLFFFCSFFSLVLYLSIITLLCSTYYTPL